MVEWRECVRGGDAERQKLIAMLMCKVHGAVGKGFLEDLLNFQMR